MTWAWMSMLMNVQLLTLQTSWKQTIAIVATYTYGDGELPDEMMDFYEDLADLNLNGKIYGVVGSGDTFYDEFCKAVDDFDRVFCSDRSRKRVQNVSKLISLLRKKTLNAWNNSQKNWLLK